MGWTRARSSSSGRSRSAQTRQPPSLLPASRLSGRSSSRTRSGGLRRVRSWRSSRITRGRHTRRRWTGAGRGSSGGGRPGRYTPSSGGWTPYRGPGRLPGASRSSSFGPRIRKPALPASPGTVLGRDPAEGLVVKAGAGALLFKEVQPAGRRRMAAGAWLRAAARSSGRGSGDPPRAPRDRRQDPGPEDFPAAAAALLQAGAGRIAFHLRGPRSPGRWLEELACLLCPVARSSGVPLLVNDRIDVALVSGADGAHLGRRSLPLSAARRLLPDGAVVGCSVHGAPEAEGWGAPPGALPDFFFVGPLFATRSHPSVAAAAPGLIAAVRAVRPGVPQLGIGGGDTRASGERPGRGRPRGRRDPRRLGGRRPGRGAGPPHPRDVRRLPPGRRGLKWGETPASSPRAARSA